MVAFFLLPPLFTEACRTRGNAFLFDAMRKPTTMLGRGLSCAFLAQTPFFARFERATKKCIATTAWQVLHPILAKQTQLLVQYQWLCFVTLGTVTLLTSVLYEWRKPYRILVIVIFSMLGQVWQRWRLRGWVPLGWFLASKSCIVSRFLCLPLLTAFAAVSRCTCCSVLCCVLSL